MPSKLKNNRNGGSYPQPTGQQQPSQPPPPHHQYFKPFDHRTMPAAYHHNNSHQASYNTVRFSLDTRQSFLTHSTLPSLSAFLRPLCTSEYFLSGFRWTLSPPNKRSISIHLYHESPLTLVVWLAPRLPPNGGKWFSLNRQSQTSTWRSGVPALGTDLATWSQNTTMQVSLLAYFFILLTFYFLVENRGTKFALGNMASQWCFCYLKWLPSCPESYFLRGRGLASRTLSSILRSTDKLWCRLGSHCLVQGHRHSWTIKENTIWVSDETWYNAGSYHPHYHPSGNHTMQRPHTSHSRHQSGSNNSSRMNHYHHHHSSNQLNSSNEAAVTPPRGYHATVGPGNAAEGQPYQYEGGPLTVLPPPPAPSYHHQVCSI